MSAHKTVEGDHGRIEARCVTVIHHLAWLQERHDWAGLQSTIIDSSRESGREPNTRNPLLSDFVSIANMTFHDDECRIRTERAPEDFVALKHMAANIARKAPGRDPLAFD